MKEMRKLGNIPYNSYSSSKIETSLNIYNVMIVSILQHNACNWEIITLT